MKKAFYDKAIENVYNILNLEISNDAYRYTTFVENIFSKYSVALSEI